ncbi:hypothetical protein SAMN05444162_0143 [Paenibacillaceae bacterium GAS479]|nr:hypothetical protein SAMN05444162_0143 [Paenibacillaceae bacterium GAS479]
MQQLQLFEMPPDFRLHKKFRDGIFRTKAELRGEHQRNGRDRIVHVLSFGGGTQSAHLLEQHFRGEVDYDYIVFADTGAEPQFIHDQVAWWQQRQRDCGNTTPFLVTHHSGMPGGLEEMLMRYILTDYQRFQMPVYCSSVNPETGEVKPAGMLPRQCTVDFKIVPVKQAVRRKIMDQAGLGYRQRFPQDVGIIIDIGFSYDEIRRISMWQSPQYDYVYLSYPLVESNESTADSIAFLVENDFPTRRSRCYLCPFNCDGSRDIGMDWDEIIQTEPISFLKACWFDGQLRAVQRTGTKIMRSIPYLHYSRRPLAEVYEAEYQQLAESHGCGLEAWRVDWESRIIRDYVQAI